MGDFISRIVTLLDSTETIEEKMRILVIFLQHLLVLATMKIRSTGSLTLTSKLEVSWRMNIVQCNAKYEGAFTWIKFYFSVGEIFHKILFSFFIKFSNNSIIQSFKIDDLCPQLYFDWKVFEWLYLSVLSSVSAQGWQKKIYFEDFII